MQHNDALDGQNFPVFKLQRLFNSVWPLLLIIAALISSFLLVTYLATLLTGQPIAAVVFLVILIPIVVLGLTGRFISEVEARPGKDELVLHTTKPGWNMALGVCSTPWNEVVNYRWIPGRQTRLRLKCKGKPTMYFQGPQHRELFQYLKQTFPEKEFTIEKYMSGSWGDEI